MTLPKEIADVLAGERRFALVNGDCLDVLRGRPIVLGGELDAFIGMPDNCVDSMVTDPPAGIDFMNLDFDSDRGGRDQWIAWLTVRMREALRVLKPGAHGLVWSLPRTSYWTALALDEAGFEIREVLQHLFSTGFPKSSDMAKAVDKRAGHWRGKSAGVASENASMSAPNYIRTDKGEPVTAAAAALQGWGTATKPSAEFWWLVRKPVRGTIVQNVLDYGTGALNIDGCRVPHASSADLEAHAAGVAAIKARGGSMADSWKNSSDLSGANDVTAAGRWPASTVFSHSAGCERVGTKKVKAAPSWNDNRGDSLFTGKETSPVVHDDGDGLETVDDWRCEGGCPVKLLDEQSGTSTSTTHDRGVGMGYHGGARAHGIVGPSDEGGASRFFMTFQPEVEPFAYFPKASRSDKEAGCEHLPRKSGGEATGRKDGTAGLNSPRAGGGRLGGRANDHPTPKSTAMLRYFCRLITPPNGVCIDIFMGSGGTGKACSAEGFRFIGIEIEAHYCEIARARICGDMPLFNREAAG